MTFSDYFDVITQSAREHGYDGFLPSLCVIDGDKVVMQVLDTDLSEGGEESLAMGWAETFAQEGRTIFLAYRGGQRTVTMMEILGFDAVRTRRIILQPYVPENTSDE